MKSSASDSPKVLLKNNMKGFRSIVGSGGGTQYGSEKAYALLFNFTSSYFTNNGSNGFPIRLVRTL